jgi:signal transduction histidine kinase
MRKPFEHPNDSDDSRTVADRPPPRRGEQQQLRDIVDHLADGIVIVGSDGMIRFANPAAEHLFGRKASTLTGTPFGFALVNGDPAPIDVVRPGGATVAAELRAVEITWEGEPSRLISIRDVTERRRAEERAQALERERAARAEAEAANRAKSDLLATMSHELRTPLNAVLGYAELLDLGIGGQLGPEQHHQVARIRASGQHLLGLVDQVLDLAKVDAGRLTVEIASFPARATADAAAALIQPLAESRGVTFADRSAGARVSYVGDEDRVRQILVNLLTNAVKFTESGGNVSLEYGETARPHADARLRGVGPWTFFRISDTGIGIPAEQLTRIFQPFVQVEGGRTRSKDGSGLGLTISRRLARLMGGDVTVRSTLGKGSEFTIWLPSPDKMPTGSVERRVAPAGEAARLRGLADIGELLLRELEGVLESFVCRLRAECPVPGVGSLKYSQLVDHVAGYVADLGGMLIALEESAGEPTSVLSDAADIHRLVAGRHGAQRARLGWNEEAIRCEYGILREEIVRVVQRSELPVRAEAVGEALGVTRRFLDDAEQASTRALARTSSTDEPS